MQYEILQDALRDIIDKSIIGERYPFIAVPDWRSSLRQAINYILDAFQRGKWVPFIKHGRWVWRKARLWSHHGRVVVLHRIECHNRPSAYLTNQRLEDMGQVGNLICFAAIDKPTICGIVRKFTETPQCEMFVYEIELCNEEDSWQLIHQDQWTMREKKGPWDALGLSLVLYLDVLRRETFKTYANPASQWPQIKVPTEEEMVSVINQRANPALRLRCLTREVPCLAHLLARGRGFGSRLIVAGNSPDLSCSPVLRSNPECVFLCDYASITPPRPLEKLLRRVFRKYHEFLRKLYETYGTAVESVSTPFHPPLVIKPVPEKHVKRIKFFAQRLKAILDSSNLHEWNDALSECLLRKGPQCQEGDGDVRWEGRFARGMASTQRKPFVVPPDQIVVLNRSQWCLWAPYISHNLVFDTIIEVGSVVDELPCALFSLPWQRRCLLLTDYPLGMRQSAGLKGWDAAPRCALYRPTNLRVLAPFTVPHPRSSSLALQALYTSSSESETAQNELASGGAARNEVAGNRARQNGLSESRAVRGEAADTGAAKNESAESEAAQSEAAKSETTESEAAESEAAASEAAGSKSESSAASRSPSSPHDESPRRQSDVTETGPPPRSRARNLQQTRRSNVRRDTESPSSASAEEGGCSRCVKKARLNGRGSDISAVSPESVSSVDSSSRSSRRTSVSEESSQPREASDREDGRRRGSIVAVHVDESAPRVGDSHSEVVLVRSPSRVSDVQYDSIELFRGGCQPPAPSRQLAYRALYDALHQRSSDPVPPPGRVTPALPAAEVSPQVKQGDVDSVPPGFPRRPHNSQGTLDGASETRLPSSSSGPTCAKPCESHLACSHPCPGNENLCCNGRLHIACRASCKKILPFCAHECGAPCTALQCPPCSQTCTLQRCGHGHQCTRPCGAPCVMCVKPCLWRCPHQKCTKLCGEVCNRSLCKHRCPRVLRCGHKCGGVCGERCPPCRECKAFQPDLDNLELVFGTEELKSARFLVLEDCGHAVEIEGLLKWFGMQTEKGYKADNMDPYYRCPFCRCKIVNTPGLYQWTKPVILKHQSYKVSMEQMHCTSLSTLALASQMHEFSQTIASLSITSKIRCLLKGLESRLSELVKEASSGDRLSITERFLKNETANHLLKYLQRLITLAEWFSMQQHRFIHSDPPIHDFVSAMERFSSLCGWFARHYAPQLQCNEDAEREMSWLSTYVRKKHT